MLVDDTLWQQSIVCQESGDVGSLHEVTMTGLNGVGAKQNRRLWWTIDLVRQDCVLNLQIEQAERDVLDQLVGDVFRVEFGAEFELQRIRLLDVLAHNLSRGKIELVSVADID